jgi:RNA polymerase sigma-70 factor (ECF subfamily)
VSNPLSSAGSGAGQVVRRPAFVTTHWSLVQSAGRNDTTQAQASLARLCELYWFPLYAYVRQRGYSPEDAQDLTQEFFARLLRQGTLAQADPARGRFRSFLLASFNHFLGHEWEKARALKRGGGEPVVSLDLAVAEQWYALEPVDPRTPDQVFETRWALALLQAVLDRLENEYCQEGKQELFAVLQGTLTGTRETQPYAVLADRLKLTEGAVKVAVHRLRKRYRELLRAEIASTVGRPEDAEAELKDLFAALR